MIGNTNIYTAEFAQSLLNYHQEERQREEWLESSELIAYKNRQDLKRNITGQIAKFLEPSNSNIFLRSPEKSLAQRIQENTWLEPSEEAALLQRRK